MNILWGDSRNPEINDNLGMWLSLQIGLPRHFEQPYSTMGVFDGPDLMACILYNNWQPEAGVIEMHGATTSARWLTRPVLAEMFAYPFEQLGCQTVVMRVSANDRRLARILKAYGFHRHLIPRLRGRHEDEVLYTLTDDDWRLNGFHRPKRHVSS